jgi:Flp pilus assembly protein TadG
MVRRFIDRFRADSGQALVELAFVLPIIMLILFGIIDFGLALNNFNGDTNLVNLAVRTASVMGASTTNTTAQCGGVAKTTLLAYVQCEATATGAPTPTYVCFSDNGGFANTNTTLTSGDPLKVKVSSTFGWMRILTGGDSYVKGLGASLSSTISASATMRIEASGTGTNPFFNYTNTGGVSPVCTS